MVGPGRYFRRFQSCRERKSKRCSMSSKASCRPNSELFVFPLAAKRAGRGGPRSRTFAACRDGLAFRFDGGLAAGDFSSGVVAALAGQGRRVPERPGFHRRSIVPGASDVPAASVAMPQAARLRRCRAGNARRRVAGGRPPSIHGGPRGGARHRERQNGGQLPLRRSTVRLPESPGAGDC